MESLPFISYLCGVVLTARELRYRPLNFCGILAITAFFFILLAIRRLLRRIDDPAHQRARKPITAAPHSEDPRLSSWPGKSVTDKPEILTIGFPGWDCFRNGLSGRGRRDTAEVARSE